MTEDKTGDDRSMSEILASIRKIVTDEERTRRAAERGQGETERAAPALELTEAMRVEPAPPGGGPDHPSPESDVDPERAAEPDDAAPLDLGREAVLVSAPVDADRSSRSDLAEIEAIVRRVVREELRGPVGLEISRRVKASIHQEVRRALADDEPLI
jgi:hypothetical protein